MREGTEGLPPGPHIALVNLQAHPPSLRPWVNRFPLLLLSTSSKDKNGLSRKKKILLPDVISKITGENIPKVTVRNKVPSKSPKLGTLEATKPTDTEAENTDHNEKVMDLL